MEWMFMYGMMWYQCLVNDVVCDRDTVSSGKEIPVLRLLGCVLFGDSKEVSWLYWYIGLDSYRWSLPVGEESKEVHMVLSEVWNMSPIGVGHMD